jgi:phage baseplate assembly protein W
VDITYGLAYPITKHPLGFLHTSTGLDVFKADLMTLLLTNPGERVMLLNYGTPLRKYMFEPNDLATANQVREIIISVISKWEPRVVIESIDVSVGTANLNADDTKNELESILSIKIAFFNPNNIAQLENLVLEVPVSGGDNA